MNITFVVAMSENRVIGMQGRLPWHLPNDLKHFRMLTLGKNILMGRKTFESIGKPLKDRANYVLTTTREWARSGVTTFGSKEAVLKSGLKDVVVIGGEEIYRLFLKDCQKIYLTLIHRNVAGDAYFPAIDGFKEIRREFHDTDDRHNIAYSFIEYERF